MPGTATFLTSHTSLLMATSRYLTMMSVEDISNELNGFVGPVAVIFVLSYFTTKVSVTPHTLAAVPHLDVLICLRLPLPGYSIIPDQPTLWADI